MGRTQVHSAKHQVAQQQQQLQSAKTKQAQHSLQTAASARPQSSQPKSQQQQQQRAHSPQNSNKQHKHQLPANAHPGNTTTAHAARPQSPSGQRQQTKLSVHAQPFYPRNMQPTQTMGKPQNVGGVQPSSRPQSAQVQRQQPQSKQWGQPQQRVQSANPMSSPAKQQQGQNAQVYRPTPVKEHPDDAFMSGAWLFDTSRVPQWMSAQLPKQVASHSQQQRATQSASIAKQQSKSNKTVTNVNASVIKMGSIKARNASPDDAFFSGAWLFDASVAPQWLSSQLPVQQKQAQQAKQQSAKEQSAKQQQQSNNSNAKRPQSPRR